MAWALHWPFGRHGGATDTALGWEQHSHRGLVPLTAVYPHALHMMESTPVTELLSTCFLL